MEVEEYSSKVAALRETTFAMIRTLRTMPGSLSQSILKYLFYAEDSLRHNKDTKIGDTISDL